MLPIVKFELKKALRNGSFFACGAVCLLGIAILAVWMQSLSAVRLMRVFPLLAIPATAVCVPNIRQGASPLFLSFPLRRRAVAAGKCSAAALTLLFWAGVCTLVLLALALLFK